MLPNIAATKLVAEDILAIVPRGAHDWNKYINAEDLREFFEGKDGGGMSLLWDVFLWFGWKEIRSGEKVGNHSFGVRRGPREGAGGK